MARPEVPVDPRSGPVAEFAYDLRMLREKAGTPSYRTLAGQTHYSVTTLSKAAAGHALPTLPVLRAFVGACGGDPDGWEGRWRVLSGESPDPLASTARVISGATAESAPTSQAASALIAQAAPAPPTPTTSVPTPPALATPGSARWRPGWRRPGGRAMVLVLAGLVVVAVTASLTIWITKDRRATPSRPAATGPVSPVRASVDPIADGSDPTRAGCGPDAVTLASVAVYFPPGHHSGSVELRYSPHCGAAWSRFTPEPTWQPGPGMVISVWTIRPADQATKSYTVPFDGLAIIGDMLMVSRGCVAAEVSMAQGEATSPIASTACRTVGGGTASR